MHGAGPLLRSPIGRANTWQLVLIAVVLMPIGSPLVAVGDVRAGIIGFLGVLPLVGTVRHRFGRRTPSPHTVGTTNQKQP